MSHVLAFVNVYVTAERDQAILVERVRDHASLRQIGRSRGLSHEAVRLALRRATHEHMKVIVAALWECARDGQVLALVIPPGFDSDQRAAITYLEWVLRELAGAWNTTPVVHYRPEPGGGCLFGLEDKAMEELIMRSRGER